MPPPNFDFKNPRYLPVLDERQARLDWLRKHPDEIPLLKLYYRDHIADFIEDWGVTYDPRNVEIGMSATIPFLLFEKQREFIDEVIAHWKARKPLLNEKSRECGVSWLCVSIGCALCLFYDGMGIGYGSRKEEYVDKVDSPKSLFWKARFFMKNLPVEFRGGWIENRDAPYMRMKFPETGSTMTGEAGDEIGRGDRQGIYFVDESSRLPRADLVEFSLSQTTNCRIDVSSVNGMNNVFAQKRHSGKVDVFIFDWHDDPRKDDAWYAKQQADYDPIVVAQEIDRDYLASVEGVVVPAKWVTAAIDARQKLGLGPPTGERGVSFDVADEGADNNGLVGLHGYEIQHAEEWSGKGDDIFGSVEKVFLFCDEFGAGGFTYDADGLGAGVRGDGRIINARRKENSQKELYLLAYRGSDAVENPDAEDFKGRTNQDFFQNRKAQAHWAMRRRFQRTYRWVVEGVPSTPDQIISISSKCPNYLKLVAEISQPTWKLSTTGKIVINKKPDGMKSPNMGDAVVQYFARPQHRRLIITSEVLRHAAASPPRRRRRY